MWNNVKSKQLFGDNKWLSPLENECVCWVPCGLSHYSLETHSFPFLPLFFEEWWNCLLPKLWNSKDI